MTRPITSDSAGRAWLVLGLLVVLNTANFYDRYLPGAVAMALRQQWRLDDRALGFVATAFLVVYAAISLPLGRLADKTHRLRMLALGAIGWSLATMAGGLARDFYQFLFLRICVGVGEATCSPIASSLIGDLFPVQRRGWASGVYILGIPLGLSLSYFVSASVAQAHGWRAAFFVAGIPGILGGILALGLPEPVREIGPVMTAGPSARQRVAVRPILSMISMRYLIIAGALHSFCYTAAAHWIPSYLQRHHGLPLKRAGLIAMLSFGVSGIPGLLLGGALIDWAPSWRRDGRMRVVVYAALATAPLFVAALLCQAGQAWLFAILMAAACALLHVYYSAVIPIIHDLVAPSQRGSALSLYFFGMYLLGASFGPTLTGWVSDALARAAAAGRAPSPALAAECAAQGLRGALCLLPLLCLALALVLQRGARVYDRELAAAPAR